MIQKKKPIIAMLTNGRTLNELDIGTLYKVWNQNRHLAAAEIQFIARLKYGVKEIPIRLTPKQLHRAVHAAIKGQGADDMPPARKQNILTVAGTWLDKISA